MLKYQRVSPGPPPFADAVFRRLHDHFGGIGDICHDVREDDPVAHEQNNGDKCRFDVPSVSTKYIYVTMYLRMDMYSFSTRCRHIMYRYTCTHIHVDV